jgi:hypothetical protein
MRLLLIVAVVALAAVAWILARGAARPPDAPANETAATESATEPAHVEDAAIRSAIAAPASASAERTEIAATHAPASPRSDLTILRGRCVDAAGAPLHGVTVTLHGGPDDPVVVSLMGHLVSPSAESPPTTRTGADGRFELRCVPARGEPYDLHLAIATHVPMQRRWNELPIGEVVDVGTIPLPDGVHVHGRVTNRDGVPFRDLQIHLHRAGRHPDGESFRSNDRAVATTLADGSFHFPSACAPGEWRLSTLVGTLVAPDARMTLAGRVHTLEVVIDLPAATKSVDGVVVDEHGQPIVDALVYRHGDLNAPRTRTRADGAFRLEWPFEHSPREPFAIVVESERHDPLRTDAVHRFDTTGVRLVVGSRPTFEVRVTREADGAPVESFGVRLLPKRFTASRSFDGEAHVRGGWRHPGGVARIRGVQPGPYLVCVEPSATSDLAPVWLVETNVAERAPTILDIRLPPRATRRVVVERSDGTPVADASVALWLPIDGSPVTLSSRADPLDRYLSTQPTGMLELASRKTDAAGGCTFDGAPMVPMALRVSANGYPPRVVEVVTLGDASPLRVVLPTGATLRGRITPIEALVDLQTMSGMPRTLPNNPISGHFTTTVRVANVTSPIAADGTFVLAGIPAGRWDVQCGVRAGGSTTLLEILESGWTCFDGQVVEQNFDISSLRPGRLIATVLVDDAPYSGEVFALRAETRTSTSLRANTNGRFEVLLLPGKWLLYPRRSAPHPEGDLGEPEGVTVVSGDVVETTIHVRTARASLRVLTPDGLPAAGVALFAPARGNRSVMRAPPTDADGRVDVVWTPGEFQLRARVRSLTSELQMRAFMDRNVSVNARAATTIVVGQLSLPAGGDVIEIRLPPEWSR